MVYSDENRSCFLGKSPWGIPPSFRWQKSDITVKAQLVGKRLNKKSFDQCLLNISKNYSVTLSNWNLIPKLNLLLSGGKNRNKAILVGRVFVL